MSTQKGNNSKKRPQKHKNEYGFVNNKYDTTGKMKEINNLKVSNVCQRCKDCIEWKIKYKKYKPLAAPAHCVRCSQRKVKYAYHVACTECALQHKICAKCNEVKEVVGLPEKPPVEQQREENFLREELKHMKLRDKRTLLRKLDKGEMDAEDMKNDTVKNKTAKEMQESDDSDNSSDIE